MFQVMFYYKNANSVQSKKKLSELNESAREGLYHFVLLTETNFNEKICNSDIMSPNYIPIRVDRVAGVNDYKKSKGGVMIAVRKDFLYEFIDIDKTIEIVALKTVLGRKTTYIIVSYVRNDNKDPIEFNHKTVLNKHLQAFKKIVASMNENDSIFIFGDFNMRSIRYEKELHFMKPNLHRVPSYYKHFMDCMHEMGLRQINDIPNQKGNFLDLVLTNEFEFCSVSPPDRTFLRDTEKFHTEMVVKYELQQ